jgi:hypothetical protein
MINWAVPWAADEVIDFVFLVTTCVIVTAVPIVYGLRANLRDRLARAVVIGTGVTAFAFCLSAVLTVGIHAGWNPPGTTLHWVARALYATVGFGKFILLMALLDALRGERERQRDSREDPRVSMEE